MNPLTITLEHRFLKAATVFASRDETRFSLCGVYLQVLDCNHGTGTVLLTSTDGRRLMTLRAQGVDIDGFEQPASAIIPTALCLANIGTRSVRPPRKGRKTYSSKAPAQTKAVITLTGNPRATGLSSGTRPIRLISVANLFQDRIFTMPEVDGNYPNYPVVFPIDAAKPAVSPTLSFEMFGDLAKVVKLLGTPHGPSGGTLYQYPNMGPLYIAAQWSHDIDMVAIIMPMRDATEYGRELNVPPWARTFVQKPEAKPEEPRDIAAVSTPEPHPAEA